VLRHLAEQEPFAGSAANLWPRSKGPIWERQSKDGRQLCDLSDGISLPGRLLADIKPAPSLMRNIGDTLARVDRALRGFFHPALAQRIAWDVRRLPELMEFAPYIESADVRRAVESGLGAQGAVAGHPGAASPSDPRRLPPGEPAGRRLRGAICGVWTSGT